MQTARDGAPPAVQLPIMYVAPHTSLAYVHAYAADLATFDSVRLVAEREGAAPRLAYAYLDPSKNRWFGAFVFEFFAHRGDGVLLARKLGEQAGLELVDMGVAPNGLAALERPLPEVVGTPVTILAREIISGTYRRLKEALGERGAAAFFEAGEAAGRQAAAGVPALVQQLGVALSPDLVRERMRDLQVFGWARIAQLRANENLEGEVLLTDTFEAAAWHGTASGPTCDWLRGFLTAALSSLQSTPFEVSESACQAAGAPHCRMAFRPLSG